MRYHPGSLFYPPISAHHYQSLPSLPSLPLHSSRAHHVSLTNDLRSSNLLSFSYNAQHMDSRPSVKSITQVCHRGWEGSISAHHYQSLPSLPSLPLHSSRAHHVSLTNDLRKAFSYNAQHMDSRPSVKSITQVCHRGWEGS
jgi:hypothetical protein